jgi:hypothetical protein
MVELNHRYKDVSWQAMNEKDTHTARPNDTEINDRDLAAENKQKGNLVTQNEIGMNVNKDEGWNQSDKKL